MTSVEIPANQVTGDDLCLYAMHLLDTAETARLETFLNESTDARAEVERIRGDLALLAFTAPPRSVSPTLLKRLQQEVAREPKSAPGPSSGGTSSSTPQPLASGVDDALLTQDSYTPSRSEHSQPKIASEPATSSRTVSLGWLWAGWALAAGMTLCSGLLYTRAHRLQTGVRTAEAKTARAAEEERKMVLTTGGANAIVDALRSGASQHFVLTATDAASRGAAHVVYSPERGALVLQASNLQPLAPGQTYAVWLFLVQGDSPPERVGTVRPDAHGFASLAADSLPPGLLASRAGITVEEAGAVQGQPSTMILTGAQPAADPPQTY